MTRKQTTVVSNVNKLKDNLYRQNFPESILANFVESNSLALHNVNNLLESISDSFSKSSLPKNMQLFYRNGVINAEGVKRIGQYFPVGYQQIIPFAYNYKPFGDKVLDFDPNTGEFITYSISEWRTKNNWNVGNTNKTLLNYIPMGLELEIIYRGSHKQCDDCFYNDDSEGNPPESFCEDEDCYSADDFNSTNVQKEMFKFLAQLNVSFGAIGTKSDAVWIAKHDSSVDLEFVSMPMTIRAYKAGFIIAMQKFRAFEKISKYAKAFYGPCGGHIHLDKDSFTNTYQYYAFLSMHYDNPEFIAAMAQRSVGQDNQWAYLYKPDEFAKVVKYKLNSASRQAVNVTQNTVELRYFRSNLKVDRLLKNMELIQSMYTFTSAMTYQDIAKYKNNTLKYYLLFIQAKRYAYPNLFNFLASRKWIKDEKLINTGIFPIYHGAMYEDNNVREYQSDIILQNDSDYNRDNTGLDAVFNQLERT
nr:hypothetical protein [uncultured Mediterranean phage uvMED]